MPLYRAKIRAIVRGYEQRAPSREEWRKRVAATLPALIEAGAVRNIHVPGIHILPGSERGAEWFAGQIVEAIAMEKWFAILAIVHQLDAWIPADPG